MSNNNEIKSRGGKIYSPFTLPGGAATGVGLASLLAHQGTGSLIAAGIAGTVAFIAQDDIRGMLDDLKNFVRRQQGALPVNWPTDEEVEQYAAQLQSGARSRELVPDDDELRPPPGQSKKLFSFSEVLRVFKPSPDKIYLATLRNGTHIYVPMIALCHISLAGATDAGKSNIMRMLMAQLCKAGARVLVLNPHWTNYDVSKKEDWTPFLPYLTVNPMECRSYAAIDHYLKQAATEILPHRLDLFAHSKPIARPIFYILDELPAIVKHCKNVPDYLDSILKEGRKVGIYLVSASQDFLVNTIGGTGAVRDCYRTAYSVGGDDTTTKKLLGTTESDEPLGKGVVLVRNASNDLIREAKTAYVPLVDNESLYQLLGPSTYSPSEDEEEDDLDLRVPRTAYQSSDSDAVSEKMDTSEPIRDTRSLPNGWTERDVELAIMIYENLGNKDLTLKAIKKTTTPDNRRALTAVLGEE